MTDLRRGERAQPARLHQTFTITIHYDTQLDPDKTLIEAAELEQLVTDALVDELIDPWFDVQEDA